MNLYSGFLMNSEKSWPPLQFATKNSGRKKKQNSKKRHFQVNEHELRRKKRFSKVQVSRFNGFWLN